MNTSKEMFLVVSSTLENDADDCKPLALFRNREDAEKHRQKCKKECLEGFECCYIVPFKVL
jgi:hypothetical protein